MSLTVEIDPRLRSVLLGVGLLGADGTLQTTWFDHPLDTLRRCLEDETQRAAIFSLLDEVLPASTGGFADAMRPAGAHWHGLLDDNAYGNVYLTVAGDLVGFAAVVGTPVGDYPQVEATVSIPLLTTGHAGVRSVVATPNGPIEFGVRADLGAGQSPSAVGIRFFINGDGFRVAVRLEDGDTVADFDPTYLDACAVDALQLLVRVVLEHETNADPLVQRLVKHLPGLLGLGDESALTPLPLTDPALTRAWFTSVVSSPEKLRAWFTHLAGAIGAGDLKQADPAVGGLGTVASPLSASVFELPGKFSLELLLGAATVPSVALHIGVGISTPIDKATLGAKVTLAALPLDGQLAVPLPDVVVGISVPVAQGSIDGGVVWDGTRVAPNLRLVDVLVAGERHTLDLSDAHAVVAEGVEVVLESLGNSLGTTGLGSHLLALLGLRKPSSAPDTWPDDLVLGADAFSGNLLTAIADLHRRILDDPHQAHPWKHLLTDLAGLLGLTNDVLGDGTRDAPWIIALDTSEVLEVRIAAWNDRTPSDPDDVQRLRIGLQVGSLATGWSLALSTEVVAFDFQPSHPTVARLVGAQHLRVSIEEPPTADIDDLDISAHSLAATASWLPGSAAHLQLTLDGLTVAAGTDVFGPMTVSLPGFDLTGSDAATLVRMLLKRVWSLFGADQTAQIVSGLFGLHDTLPDLPSDWPLIFDDIDNLDALLADPMAHLVGYARKVLTGASIESTPFVVSALTWLAPVLEGQVPYSSDELPATQLAGAGTYDDPWTLAIAGSSMAELLVWLDPKPSQDPFLDGTVDLRTATFGEQLMRTLPPSDLVFARDPVLTGNALDELSLWLASGDGLVPYDSQIAVPATWTVAPPVALPHDEVVSDASVISAVQAQLATWGAAPVLLLRMAQATSWEVLLKVLEPGHDPDAQLDLNASLAGVTAVSHCYPVTLTPGDPIPQIHQAVARVRQLTGAAQVVLVGHGPGGVAARLAADTNVVGVVTVCAPHGGSSLDPLVRSDLADAVRLADRLGAPAVSRLREILDGGPAVAGALPPPGTYTVGSFAGVPDLTATTVAGLAIGSKLGGDLVVDLARRASAVQSSPVPGAAHVGVGARIRLAATAAAVGDGDASLAVRADFLRLRVGDGPEPARPAHRLTFLADLGTHGGYLLGDAGARTDGTTRAAARVRWAEFGAHLDRAEVGGVAITPVGRLVEAAGPGANPRDLTTAELIEALVGEPIPVPEDLAGAAELARQCLQALDVLTGTGDIDGAKLREVFTSPSTAVTPHLPALVDVVAEAFGAVKVGEVWSVPLLGDHLKLTLEESPWRIGVIASNTDDLDATAGLAAGLELDASVTLPGFVPTAAVSVQVGVLRLGWHDRQLQLSAPPWLAPVRLAPHPDPTAIGEALGTGLPRVVLSMVLAIFVAPATGRVPALDRLFLEPSAFLRDSLGNGTGGFSADKVNKLLDTIATALGVDTSTGDHGSLPLPGGLLLHAVDPFELKLHGDVPVPLAGTTFSLELGLRIDDQLNVSPSGEVSLSVGLDGSWTAIQIDLGIAPSGMALSVTPTATNRIEILPHFDGLGALGAASTALLPHVLQQIVNEFDPKSPWLVAVLDVAAAVGIYGDDNDGFELASRSAELARMLQAGWLVEQANDSVHIAGKIAALFATVPLPLGTVTASQGLVDWVVPIDNQVSVTTGFGWQQGQPVITVKTADLRLGPVVVTAASIGWDGSALQSTITSKLDTDGVLAPVHLALQVALDGDRFSVEVLPLGPGTGDRFTLKLAPQLTVVATKPAAIDLVVQWALPLAAELMLVVFGDGGANSLLKHPFWNAGPSAHDVLVEAELLTGPANGPYALADPLMEDPLAALLGALKTLARGVSFPVTDSLNLTLVNPADQLGVRVSGSVSIPAEDATVTVRFGSTAAPAGATGLTLWLGKLDGTDVLLRPGLTAEGVGVIVSGEPLVDGTFTMGSVGGLAYFDADFTDATGAPAVHVGDLGAGLTIQEAFLQLDSQDGDSFLAKIIPPQLQAPFDVTVEYRHGQLHVSTTAPGEPDRIELIVPLDVDLTIIQITELLLALQLDPAPVSIEVALSGGAELGPLLARVKRVGVILTVGPGGGLAFRAPDEVGLSIDTSTLTLAGLLLVDSEHGRYVGGVEITLLNTFQLTAIGIILTKPAFSLLIIVSMRLPVPITLGYGFFLTGAGGLLGLNRGFELSELVGRLKTGAAESILFPTDIVRRADSIIRDLEAIFPPAPGQFLVGPMVEISWSTPPLITIQLGIVLSIGRLPPVIAIIGLVRAALPDKDEPVLDLKVAFVGAVDVAAQLLRFDASIFDSYIGFDDFKLSIEGDIAVRLSWSSQPDFVMSVGGFHPAYKINQSLQLPQLKRLTISLLRDNPRLVLTTYFAITANSIQFGARLDFFIGVSGFSIEGMFGFDVLFQIAPFAFDARVQASLAVKAGGTSVLSLALDFSLRGPTPWIARGTAEFSILFFSVKVAFEARFGAELTTSMPDVAVLPELVKELSRSQNWVGQLDPISGAAITLIPLDTADDVVVVEPGGSLTISQRVLPLATPLSRFGTSRPIDISQVTISALRLGGHPGQGGTPAQSGTAVATSVVQEKFSPGAYAALKDDDKLSSVSFVPRPAGVAAAVGRDLMTSYVLPRRAQYDLIVMDSTGSTGVVESAPEKHDPPAAQFTALARGGAAGQSAQSQDRRVRAQVGLVVDVGAPGERFVVTGLADVRPRLDDGDFATAPVDANGQPQWGADVALDWVDAERRAASLTGVQVIPVAQAVAI